MNVFQNIGRITLWVFAIFGVISVFVASLSTTSDVQLKDVKVNITYGDDNYFLTNEDVREMVLDLGYQPGGASLQEVDLPRIEFMLENNPFVEEAEVYDQLDGTMYVDVTLRQPILRIFNTRGESIYLDNSGKFIPLNPHYVARTPIANGYILLDLKQFIGKNIEDLADTSHITSQITLIKDLFRIARSCRNDQLWKAQFNQFYVNEKYEIELIPRVGDHIVVVGNAEKIDEKLEKLKLFYSEGLNKTGWNEYKRINLKYTNQVICSKN